MTWSRRSFLIAIALSLFGGDALFLFWRAHSKPFEIVTYVGLDSFYAEVPASKNGAALLNGRWEPALGDAEIATEDMGGNQRLLWLISLAPTHTYGLLLASIRDLKARKKCNVLIREGSVPTKVADAASHMYVGIPAFILCGRSIGDAGFNGKLPPDGAVRP